MDEVKAIQIRWATVNDIEKLIAVRLDYLAAAGAMDIDSTAKLIANMRVYFYKHLSAGDFLGALAEDGDGRLVASAFLMITELPPGLSFPNGMASMLMNVFTYPDFRGLGLATALVHFIVSEASARHLDVIDLLTTNDAMPIYKRIGFADVGYFPLRLRVVTEAEL